ncbi:hypothetical protein NDS46_30110 (plasmid) [Paenibacillus thiaminolyticus]|uniref:hypothetical protein n=1 Tax=Paenibacillus thiaminolyticus TaxID=49283 RepID=UPI00232C9A14|nr:hypothetical protein [Paenibacillus thiaminolyticus]WCF11602.1 hypothetical protein NDS46_30110 [Paenibacillus thiaminolyticus]
MTIDEVIQLGEAIEMPSYGMFPQFDATTWFWAISLFFVGSLFSLFWMKSKFLDAIGGYMMLAAVIIFILNVLSSLVAQEKDYHRMINDWREKVATPFIESLPVEKKEIVFIKIEPELSPNVKGSSFLGTGYTYTTQIEKTPLTVSYKDKGVVTKTDWYEAYMELTADEDSPFIEFQRVEKDLGHGIKAGIYNSRIFLPESYKFTDIK